MEAQTLSVKRAEVEWHNFAALGEPERVLSSYAAENRARGALIRKHHEFVGALSPFLEIGACAGHTSYLLANEFGAAGFALDISADALRWGVELMDLWRLARAPVRIAGDAVHLPFRDGSIRFVLAFQMLSQFMDIEQVFVEVKRVLAPGGVFMLGEEPLRRTLTLGLYRCPYQDRMKPWERKLFDWGLLGYLVRDVIGAYQEESFGIRQNHTLNLKDWDGLIRKHFVAHEYEMFVPERGWGEKSVKRVAVRLDPYRSVWRAARLLGGSLTAFCRKEGAPDEEAGFDMARFETALRCPDCGAGFERDAAETLVCVCGYRAPNEGGVYNLLPSAERRELYPGDRADTLDVGRPGHVEQLGDGWYELEGVYGNKYRWIGPRATARLRRLRPEPLRLRIRGFAPEQSFARGEPVRIAASVNGQRVGELKLDRPGLFVFEADVPEFDEYQVEITAAPVLHLPGDARALTVNLSMVRLVPRE